MLNTRAFLRQLRALTPILISLYIPIAILIIGVGTLSARMESLNLRILFDNVTTIGSLPFYAGAISQLGILLWCVAATVCWFAYYLLGVFKVPMNDSRRFLLFSAIFTTILLFDDLFSFHKQVAPLYLGIPEALVQISLFALGVLYIIVNNYEIQKSEYILLLLALAFFIFWVGIDAVPNEWFASSYYLRKFETLVKDWNKFSAIITWTAFFVRYSFTQVARLKAV
jgi:hypothetical protein